MAGEFDRNNIKNTNKICNFTKEYLSNYSDEYYTSDEQVKDMIERVELDKS